MPIIAILSKFNWVDLVVLLLFLRMCFIGSKTGFVIEFFKISGWLLSIYISLHYFSQAGSLLNRLIPPVGLDFANFFCFIFLAALSYATVVIIREAIMRLVKVEATNILDRWGGMVLGFLRSFMAVSMLFISFYLSSNIYFVESVKKSYMGNRLVYTNVRIYECIHDGIVSKFVPDTQLNKGLYDALESEKAEEPS